MTRYAVPILAAILCITVFLAIQLPKLRVDTSVIRMLVEDLPAKHQYDRYREEFGGVSDDIVVVFREKEVFSKQVLEKLGKLTKSLRAFSGVKGVGGL